MENTENKDAIEIDVGDENETKKARIPDVLIAGVI